MLNIVTDPDTDGFAWSSTIALADAHRLTTCDAACLEPALRLGLPLATLDGELREAASTLSVKLLGA